MNLIIALCVVFLMIVSSGNSYATTYVVHQMHPAADDGNMGTPEEPLKTISGAAGKVRAGDTVIIHDGIYRERIRVSASGTAEAPIIFAAAPGASPVITGSEPLTGPWEDLGDGLFRTRLPDRLHNMGWLFVDGHPADHVDMVEPVDDEHFAVGSFILGGYPAGPRMGDAAELSRAPAVFTIGSAGRASADLPVAPDVRPAAGEVVEDGLQWQVIETDTNGTLDLAKALERPPGNGVVFALAYVYSPSDQPGALRKPAGRLEGDRPTFTGRYEPDRSPEVQAQPMRAWVNGRPVRWEQRTPRATQLGLREGWNTILLMLTTRENGPWRIRMGITAQEWGRPSDVKLFAQVQRPDDPAAPPAAGAPNHLLDVTQEDSEMRGVPLIGQWLVVGPFPQDRSDGMLYVRMRRGGSPAEHEMEWATRPHTFEISETAEHVHLKELVLRHAANGPQHGLVRLGPKGIIEACEVTDSLGRGIDVGRAPGAIVRNCRVNRHGCTGIGGRAERLQLLYNELIGNNWMRNSHGWESGGMKIVRARDSIIRGNRVQDNEAWGIWLDWECVGNRVEGNVCVNNRAAGIFLEASRGRNVIANNIAIGTRMGGADWGDGIYMHDTSDTLIAHNLCLDNAQFGIRVNLRTSRTLDNGKEVESSYNTTVNNICAGNGAAGLHIPVDRARQWGNRSDGNLLMPREQDGAVAQSSLGPLDDDARMDLFGPMGATMSSAPFLPLELWQRLAFDRHSLAAQPVFLNRQTGDFRPAPSCPSLNHMVPILIEVSDTIDGHPRRFPATIAGPFERETREEASPKR